MVGMDTSFRRTGQDVVNGKKCDVWTSLWYSDAHDDKSESCIHGGIALRAIDWRLGVQYVVRPHTYRPAPQEDKMFLKPSPVCPDTC